MVAGLRRPEEFMKTRAGAHSDNKAASQIGRRCALVRLCCGRKRKEKSFCCFLGLLFSSLCCYEGGTWGGSVVLRSYSHVLGRTSEMSPGCCGTLTL